MRDPKTNLFRAAHDRSELMEIAEAVLRQAAAEEIGCAAGDVIAEEVLTVSQSAFDRNRAAAGYPLAPPARELCRRVGQPWGKVKGYVAEGRRAAGVLAQAPVRQREWRQEPEAIVPGLRAVGRRLGVVCAVGDGEDEALVTGNGGGGGGGGGGGEGVAPADDDNDDDRGDVTVAAATTTVAAAGDSFDNIAVVVSRMSKDAYEREREAMLREDRRRRHGGRLNLPTVTQVVEAVGGDWGAALELAGLPNSEWRAGARGLSVAEALDLCFQQHGVLPTQKELEKIWMPAQGVPFSRKTRRWPEELEDFRSRWAARGVTVPEAPPPLDQRPDYTLRCPDLPEQLPPTHRRKARRTHSQLVDAVVSYLEQLPPGAEASARGYRAWAEQRPDQPSVSTLEKRAGWSALLTEARQRVREEPAPPGS